MGVDIYGRKPKIVTEGPKPIDCRSSSDEEKSVYWYKLAKWEKENPGIYFSSNWWCWRPIHILCEMANDKYKLKMNMEYWGSNDGKGLRTQKQCDRLADALELMLNHDPIYKDFMANDSNVFYMVTGSWNVTDTGEVFLDEEDELNEEYEYGTILWAPVVTKKGVIVETAYSCSLEDIKAWINFLRECGGFKIW
jgi:hypothetical protein